MPGSNKVVIEDLGIDFPLSYNRRRSAADWVRAGGHRLAGKQEKKIFTALDGVSATLKEGDVVGIVGPNGSGKSTFLKAVCGIYSPNRGRVSTFGRVSTLLALGTGFDNRLSGLDNIRLNGLTLGMTKEEIESKIPEIVEFAEIGDHILQPMKYYSSGMISRVGFAIVLAMQPDILLIDEVFSVGDLRFQKKSANAMDTLFTHASCQIIVSHDLKFIEEHCNRALYLRGGRLMADGKPGQVILRYTSEYGTQ